MLGHQKGFFIWGTNIFVAFTILLLLRDGKKWNWSDGTAQASSPILKCQSKNFFNNTLNNRIL